MSLLHFGEGISWCSVLCSSVACIWGCMDEVRNWHQELPSISDHQNIWKRHSLHFPFIFHLSFLWGGSCLIIIIIIMTLFLTGSHPLLWNNSLWLLFSRSLLLSGSNYYCCHHQRPQERKVRWYYHLPWWLVIQFLFQAVSFSYMYSLTQYPIERIIF